MFKNTIRFRILMLAPLLIYGLSACDCRRHDAEKEKRIIAGNADAGANTLSVTGLPKTVRTSDGRIFHNVKLVRSEPDGLLILYRGPASKGMAKLEFTDLPEDIRRLFNYDMNKAEEFKSDRRAKANKANAKKPAFVAPIISTLQAKFRPASSSTVATSAQAPTGLPMSISTEIDEIAKIDPAVAEEIRMFYASKPNITNLQTQIPASAR